MAEDQKQNPSSKVETTKSPFARTMVQGTETLAEVPTAQKAGIRAPQRMRASVSGQAPTPALNVVADVPSIMMLKFRPTLGDLATVADRGNFYAASWKFYTAIRQANASLSAYEPADINKFMFVISNIALISEPIRAILKAMSLKGSQTNAAFPEGFMQAYNIQSNDLVHYIDYVAKFNILMDRLAGVLVPSEYKLFERWVGLCGIIWADDPNITKGQYYVFMPDGYWHIITDELDPNVGNIMFEPVDPRTATISDRLSHLEGVIDFYLQDQDFQNISAEIAKAKITTQYNFAKFDVGATPTIAFSQGILDQIKNSDIHSFSWGGGSRDIYISDFGMNQLQYKGDEVQNGKLVVHDEAVLIDEQRVIYLNAHEDLVPGADIADMTTFVAPVEHIVVGTTHYNVIATCSTEVLSGCEIHFFDGIRQIWTYSSVRSSCIFDMEGSSWRTTYLPRILAFSAAPMLYYYNDTEVAATRYAGDLDNYFPLPIDMLHDINMSCFAYLITPGSKAGSSTDAKQGKPKK